MFNKCETSINQQCLSLRWDRKEMVNMSYVETDGPRPIKSTG